MVNIGIIIQARMGSTRLPGKILMPVGDKLLLEHIISGLEKLKHNTKIIIATSNLKQDDKVEEFCTNHGITCFRGSESNVLERYYLCAKQHSFNHIVRITGDNPFYDINELDNLITLHIESNADYSQSFESLPVGVGAEIFTFNALEKSYKEGHLPKHIEHVDEYILDNPHLFKISKLTAANEISRHDITLTIDTPDDYKKLCDIAINCPDLSTKSIIEYIDNKAKI